MCSVPAASEVLRHNLLILIGLPSLIPQFRKSRRTVSNFIQVLPQTIFAKDCIAWDRLEKSILYQIIIMAPLAIWPYKAEYIQLEQPRLRNNIYKFTLKLFGGNNIYEFTLKLINRNWASEFYKGSSDLACLFSV